MLRTERQAIATLVLAVFAVYTNALLWGVFQFDDYNVIVGNPAVQTWQGWWAEVGHGIRPLLKLSYAVDWNLGGGAPGFHFTNLLIHAGNTLLVWRLSVVLLGQSDLLAARAGAIGFATALLFAVHPIHTEAVSYISGRSSSLMALCYLAGLLCHLTGWQRQSRLYLHLVTPLLFVAALAVKEIAITFPLALLLVHVYSGGTWRTALAQIWSSWLVCLAGLLFFVLDADYSTHLLRSLAAHDGWPTLVVQTHALAYLLGQWWWPLELNIDPDLRGMGSLATLQSGLLLAALGGGLLLWRSLRHRPWLGFALGWLLLQLWLVYLAAPRLDIANERQLYLASWPLLLALTTELALWLDTRGFVVVCAGLALAAATLTVMRNQDYRSELALWQATVTQSPAKARVHNNLGYAYFLDGQPESARRHYLRALALEPDNFKARYNLQALEPSRQ